MNTAQTQIEMNNKPTKDIYWDAKQLHHADHTIRAIDHKLRQRILNYINAVGPVAVTDIYVKLRLEQSVASQHLAILRRAGLVISKREGKKIYYTVNLPVIHDIIEALSDFEANTKK